MNCPSCGAGNESSAKSCFACGAPLDPALARLADGALFASRFEILGPLGRGGMGMVYRAFDRELGETVAIKVLRPDVARDSGRNERRFRSEIRLARRVRHRNVCSVYGDGEDRGLLYICMELVEGENLARSAREGSGLPPAEAWSATLQVAAGLRAIHEVGVVHRDLKTANLMRDPAGVVRVMDFGIAKQHGPGATGATVTATGALMGTPEYMSPEQLRGEEVDFRSDLYSLGVVVYELFTGALPFRGDTPVATIVKQLQDAPDLSLPALPRIAAAGAGPGPRQEPRRPLRHGRRDGPGPRGGLGGAGAGRRAGARAGRRRGPPRRRDAPGAPRGRCRSDPPILRMAVAQAALAALAVHLVSAGGVLTAPPPAPPPLVAPAPVPTPASTPSPSRRRRWSRSRRGPQPARPRRVRRPCPPRCRPPGPSCRAPTRRSWLASPPGRPSTPLASTTRTRWT